MRTRRAFVKGALAAAFAATIGAPRTSHALTFPRLAARNLLREDVYLPSGFSGSRNLVFVVSSRHQQADVDSWRDSLGAMQAQARSFERWQATMMGDVGEPLRSIVEGAMRGIVKDDAVRKHYLLIYGEKSSLLAGFGHPRKDEILLLLLDGSGDELWRGNGAWTQRTEESLRFALQS